MSKAEYANKLLYIATLVFAKLSIISLLKMLTESTLHTNLSIALIAIISVWGFVSIFVAAFPCGKVEPWRFIEPRDKCLNLVGTTPTPVNKSCSPWSRYHSGSAWGSSTSSLTSPSFFSPSMSSRYCKCHSGRSSPSWCSLVHDYCELRHTFEKVKIR